MEDRFRKMENGGRYTCGKWRMQKPLRGKAGDSNNDETNIWINVLNLLFIISLSILHMLKRISS